MVQVTGTPHPTSSVGHPLPGERENRFWGYAARDHDPAMGQ